MATGSSHRTRSGRNVTLTTSQVRRVDFSDASDELLDRSIYLPDSFTHTSPLNPLEELQTDRDWYPTPYPTAYQRARTVFGTPARLVAGRARPSARPRRGQFAPSLTHVVGFDQPKTVIRCIRRKQRKEVLHALKVAGRGGLKHPRRNVYSSISCG